MGAGAKVGWDGKNSGNLMIKVGPVMAEWPNT